MATAKDETIKEVEDTKVKGKKNSTKEDEAKELSEALAQKTERKKAFFKDIKKVNAAIQKKSGDTDTVIATISDFGVGASVKRFSSGSLVLDSISGGGFPKGRVIEIYGPEASGKTSIALNGIANIQREGGNAVFIDAEQALDTNYAKILGVNVDNLALAQISVAEDALQLCVDLASAGNTDLIVVDSVAALVPKAEAEGGMDKQQVGLMARIMSKGLRVLTPICAKNNVTIIFLNQIREKVGVMFGNPETTPGGKALKFFASQRIEIRKKTQEKVDNEIIGTVVKMKMVKNKVAAPFKEGLTVLTFLHGINRPAELLVVGEEKGILFKQGNSYFYDPKGKEIPLADDQPAVVSDNLIKLGSKKADALTSLENNKELYEAISETLSEYIANEREGQSTY